MIGIGLLLAGGCAGESNTWSDTIRRYCLLLADGYSRLDMSALPHVATAEEAARLEHHMAALTEAQVRMEAKLLAIEFQTMDGEGGNRALVTANEDWSYRYLNLATGQEDLSNTIHYRTRYHLAKAENRWLVAAVDILDSREERSVPALSFWQRPADKAKFRPAGSGR